MRTVFMLGLVALTACGVPQTEHDRVVDENKALQAQNAELKGKVTKLEAISKRKKPPTRPKAAPPPAEKIDAWLKEAEITRESKLAAVFKTSMGDIRCELMPAKAPLTVANFVALAEGKKEWTHPKTREKSSKPIYDGTIFHRVIKGFMIQGGDPMGTGRGGPGYRFEDETANGLTFDKPGILAMANSGPNTNGSQFFITDSTPAHLNGRHTIFGQCDLEVAKKVIATPTTRDKPNEDVTVNSVVIERG